MDGSTLSAATMLSFMVVDVELGAMAINIWHKDGLGVVFVVLGHILGGIKIMYGMFSLLVKCVPQGSIQIKDCKRAQIVKLEKARNGYSRGKASCDNCPVGQVSEPGWDHCNACLGGQKQMSGSTCDNCPGQYNPSPAQTQCWPCDTGKYSATYKCNKTVRTE